MFCSTPKSSRQNTFSSFAICSSLREVAGATLGLKGKIAVFDRGYNDYKTFNEFTEQ
jgi:hypothetical protein